MKKEFTLSFIFIALFTNSIYAYNSNNKCETLLKNGDNKKAIIAAKELTNKYDSYFCSAKANYRIKNYAIAINEFDESNKYAELPVDQLYSYLYKGITERDSGDIKTSTSTFTKGLDTAALGNSKYMQMEHRFFYQLGKSITLGLQSFFQQPYQCQSLKPFYCLNQLLLLIQFSE